MKATSWSVCALLVVTLCIAGCNTGDSLPTGNVSGIVKYNGKALNSGIVTFSDSSGHSGASPIDAEGKYSVHNAPVGKTVVTVDVPASSTTAGAKDIMNANKPAPVTIPAKYADKTKTDVKFDAKSGTQTFDIDLK